MAIEVIPGIHINPLEVLKVQSINENDGGAGFALVSFSNGNTMLYEANKLTIDFCDWAADKFGVVFNRLKMYREHGVGRVQDHRQIWSNFKTYVQEELKAQRLLEEEANRPTEFEEVYADTSEIEDVPMFTITVHKPKTVFNRIMKWIRGWFK